MKKVYILLAIIICAATFNLWYVGVLNFKQESTLYSKPAQIVEIENDIVTVEDDYGYLWTFYSAEGRQTGDKVVCIMNTKKTASIFDDEIVNVTFEK
jgi:hypothetical protein